jgi:hypothetical protein
VWFDLNDGSETAKEELKRFEAIVIETLCKNGVDVMVYGFG